MPCLLGVPDEQINAKHNITAHTSKIGGVPDWYSGKDVAAPVCPRCSRALSLVVQLYCPLDGSPYHRTLYVFGCTCPTCWNTPDSWVVYRSQHLDDSPKSPPVSADQGTDTGSWGGDGDNWGMEADDWGTEADDWGAAEGNQGSDMSARDWSPDTSTGLGQTSQIIAPSCKVEPGCVTSTDDLPLQELSLEDSSMESGSADGTRSSVVVAEDLPTLSADARSEAIKSLQAGCHPTGDTQGVLVSYYINVIEEPSNQLADSRHVTKLLKEYQRKEGCDLEEMAADMMSSCGDRGGSEKYERGALAHKDTVFHKFQKTIAVCPEQCIRYEWSGSPVFIRQPPMSLPTRCRHCQGVLVFELQLTPALVNLLKFQHSTDTAMEFGSVLVFSCRQSCWRDEADSFRREELLVQSDPDQELFK